MTWNSNKLSMQFNLPFLRVIDVQITILKSLKKLPIYQIYYGRLEKT